MTIPKAKLENEIKQERIARLKTGDLVKLQADVLPIIYHYGIIVKTDDAILMYHLQMSLTNSFGGNLIVENFSEYAKGRKIVSVEQTGLNQSQITEIAEKLKSKRYHLVKNNCETFVSEAVYKKSVSPQLISVGLALVIATGLYFVIKGK